MTITKKLVEAAGVEGEEMLAMVRVGSHGPVEHVATDGDAREPSRTDPVASLATALATAVIDDDRPEAVRLALKLLRVIAEQLGKVG